MNIPQHEQQQLMTTTTAPNWVWVATLGVYLPPLPPQNLLQEESAMFLPMPSISVLKSTWLHSRQSGLLISCKPDLYSTSASHQKLWEKRVNVGEFSVDEERALHLDRRRVRYLYEGIIEWPNLTMGMETRVVKDFYTEGIDQILRWISRKAMPGNSLKKTIHECDFVGMRGTLSRLLTSPYDLGSCSYYDVGFKVACVKYKGVYFLRAFASQTQLDRESKRSFSRRQANYAGIRFEQICTTAELGGQPCTQMPINENNEFFQVFEATLNSPSSTHSQNGTTTTEELPPSFRLLYAAQIDCLSKEGQNLEMKTQYLEYGISKKFASKALKWWIQSFLAGIDELVIGLHDDLILNAVELHSVDLLPAWFKPEVNMATCFAFLYSFLKTVKEYLDARIEGMILLVERRPSSHRFKFRFILPESAEAAEYRVLSEEFKAHNW